MSGENDLETIQFDSGDVTALARLSLHVKENNIAYLIATLVAYQMGILDKLVTYGSGMC
jgi:hypothetical protein